MASYNEIPIRAIIQIGDGLEIATPFINSIGVSKKRGMPSATFQASVRIHTDDINAFNSGIGVGGDIIRIYAGVNENEADVSTLPRIFTGYILTVSMQPDFTNDDYTTVNMSGKDLLSVLEGQKVTRRAKPVTLERYGVIENVIRRNKRYDKRIGASVKSNATLMDYDKFLQQENTSETRPNELKVNKTSDAPVESPPALTAQNKGQYEEILNSGGAGI